MQTNCFAIFPVNKVIVLAMTFLLVRTPQRTAGSLHCIYDRIPGLYIRLSKTENSRRLYLEAPKNNDSFHKNTKGVRQSLLTYGITPATFPPLGSGCFAGVFRRSQLRDSAGFSPASSEVNEATIPCIDALCQAAGIGFRKTPCRGVTRKKSPARFGAGLLC
jgi:hypothetical protein